MFGRAPQGLNVSGVSPDVLLGEDAGLDGRCVLPGSAYKDVRIIRIGCPPEGRLVGSSFRQDWVTVCWQLWVTPSLFGLFRSRLQLSEWEAKVGSNPASL